MRSIIPKFDVTCCRKVLIIKFQWSVLCFPIWRAASLLNGLAGGGRAMEILPFLLFAGAAAFNLHHLFVMARGITRWKNGSQQEVCRPEARQTTC